MSHSTAMVKIGDHSTGNLSGVYGISSTSQRRACGTADLAPPLDLALVVVGAAAEEKAAVPLEPPIPS